MNAPAPAGHPHSTTPPVELDRAPRRRVTFIPPDRDDLAAWMAFAVAQKPPTLNGRLDHHRIHDYGSNGRCRIDGCPVYDLTEDDDRMTD